MKLGRAGFARAVWSVIAVETVLECISFADGSAVPEGIGGSNSGSNPQEQSPTIPPKTSREELVRAVHQDASGHTEPVESPGPRFWKYVFFQLLQSFSFPMFRPKIFL